MAGVECVGLGTQTVSPPYSPPSTRHSLHWSRHLKCQVCFGYLKQPVTLSCGHSFCRRCLVQLAQTTRELSPGVPQRFLTISCPSCRTVFLANAILQRRIPTSFLLQNLLEDWKRERSRLRTNSCVPFRSICTQTAPTRQSRFRQKKDDQDRGNWHEEYHVVWRPDQDYYTAMMSDVNSESSDELELQKPPPAAAVVEETDSDQEASTTDSNSSFSSAASSMRGFQLGGRRIRRRGGLLELNGRNCSDWSPARVLLMSIWCMYSIVVVGLAQCMLPYMVLITLLFLLVILK